MTSFVTDSLVNPVLRQARRFSFSRSFVVSNTNDSGSSLPSGHTFPHSQHDGVISVISEIEGSSVHNESKNSSSSQQPTSRNSGLMSPHEDIENRNSLSDTLSPTGNAPFVGIHGSGSPSDLSSAAQHNLSTREPSSSPLMESALQDHHLLPEDDGMSLLRKRIITIQAQEIGHSEKARLMHQLLMEGYTNSRAHLEREQSAISTSPRSSEKQALQGHGTLESFKFWPGALDEVKSAESFALTEQDLEPSFVPKERSSEPASAPDSETDDGDLLGCEHYRRNVKLECSTCKRWYPCRFCHDKVEDHILIRKETRHMLCMLCGTAQKASQTCVTCEAQSARYYCDICKLWNDDPDKPCYHCNDCGICRIGHGIGKDFYHCKKCCACITIASQSDHKCIERVIDCDCPICGDYLFTSPKPVCFMKCGHSIHRDCFEEHQKSSYKCPLCNKSLVNMESQFRNLELSIQAQPMPLELRDTRAIVLCHDCSAKSSTTYHWLGLKCAVCHSYNTAQLQIIGMDAGAIEHDRGGRGTQTSGLTQSGTPHVTIRDTRRRHSSVTGPAFMDPHLTAHRPDRLARSASPITTLGRLLHSSRVGGYFDLEEEQEEGDIFGFWRTRNDKDDDDDCTESSEDDLALDGDMDEEGEESEDDDFELLGHR
ncbi:hypothetical protein GGS21DRAFT_539926 [Xylaria nigripes]|nr:hypothetical protein GGS21DRAFT_539926 [Xylaria nigripes]